MKKTKIICTVGPACDSEEKLEQLIAGGANVFRLNFSHGNHTEHGARIDRIHALRERLQIPLGIVLDTKGPEIRIGTFASGPISLKQGDRFTLTTREVPGDASIVSITYQGLPEDVKVGTNILIDDGLVSLTVEEVNKTDVICTVQNGGELSDRKGVNVPGVDVRLPAITEKDVDDILFGIEKGVEFIAASFVRKASDILEIRRLLQENGGAGIQIISKVECRQAVENIEEIIKVSDAVMVARGDLGVEVPMQRVPIIQKEIISMCKALGRPVVVATQLLDSMIRNPRPTRAEVNDVASAVYDGCDCVMLSGETASGKYPVQALKTMAAICNSIEAHTHILPAQDVNRYNSTITDAVSHACCQCAEDVQAKAIITSTSGGHTARMIAKYRPQCQIIATTQNRSVYHRMSMVWGVQPLMSKVYDSTDEMIDASVEAISEAGLVKDGDVVVISAGVPVGVSGSTNLLKVHIIGAVLSQGKGIGRGTVHGRVCVVHSVGECQTNFQEGDILVAPETDHDYLPFMRLAKAIIVEDPRPDCHTAIVGVAMGTPVILGAKHATQMIKNGCYVTVEPERGTVLNRQS